MFGSHFWGQLLEYLLSIGADPGRSLNTPRVAVRYLPVEYISFSAWIPESILKLLLQHGALAKGTYALQLAAQSGRVKVDEHAKRASRYHSCANSLSDN